jgi:hypothetical protein
MTTPTTDEKLLAPHGRDENGVPLHPYGFKMDGNPKLSNRGAKPGQRGNGGKVSSKKPIAQSTTDAKRKEMLLGLADMLIITPLAGISASPVLAKKLGERQTDALAGDAVIVSYFAPSLADSLIVLAQSKPSALSWLDTVEEKAPYLMLMQVGVQMTKAFLGNHLNPDPKLAESGRTLARLKVAQMAQDIEDEASAMGIPTDAQMASQAA